MNQEIPYRVADVETLVDEFYKLKRSKGLKLTWSVVGYKCSNLFFQYARMSSGSRWHIFRTPVEYWEQNKDKILSFHQSPKSEGDLFASWNFLSKSASQFPPSVALKIYKRLGATSVLDPYSGWGDRCLAAMALGVDYIGIDSNKELVVPYKKMIETYKSHTKSKVVFINDRCEHVDLSDYRFDLVFTSPPFWYDNKKMFEKYSGCETDYDKFMNESLIPMMGTFKSLNKRVCLYIPQNMADDLMKLFGDVSDILTFRRNSGLQTDIYFWDFEKI